MTDVGRILDVDEWYKGAIVAGLALAVGALAFHERGFAIVGLGAALIGFGEWLNHPHRQRVFMDGAGRVTGVVDDRSRQNRPAGIVLGVFGGAVAVFGFVLIFRG